MDIDWKAVMRDVSEVEDRWSVFKDRLVTGMNKFIPKVKNFQICV